MSKKSIMMFSLCVGIAVMAIAYAAFSTTLNITTTATQSGTFDPRLTGCSCTVKNDDLSGVTLPSDYTCSPTGTALSTKGGEATISVGQSDVNGDGKTTGFLQPGDVVTCTFSVKNNGNLKIKANGNASCTVRGGVHSTAGTESSSLSTPLYYTVSWKKTALAAGATATNDITIVMGYSSNITSQPTTTSGGVVCSFPYAQNI